MNEFWLICEDETRSICHCDWRVTLSDCIERDIILHMYITNLALSAFMLVTGTAILVYRVWCKQCNIFDPVPYTIFMRPRPIESLLVFGLIFTVLRIVSMALTITNAAPNPIITAFFYELPWQFGICALACYIFGIAHIVSNSYNMTAQWSVFSASRVDIVFTLQIICPFVLNNVFSISAAVYAQKGNFFLAKIFTSVLYYMWTLYCLFLALCSLYFGIGLIDLLKVHLKNQKDEDEDDDKIQKIRNAIFRVKMLVYNIVLTLFVFAILKCIYSTRRSILLENKVYSYITAAIWTFDGTIASAFVGVTLLVNPKYINPYFFTQMSNSTDSLCCSDLTEEQHVNRPMEVHQKPNLTREDNYFVVQKNEYELATGTSRVRSKGRTSQQEDRY